MNFYSILLVVKKYIQHDFLKVANFVSKEWKHPVHNHNHFEIIFIHRGKGLHHISGMEYRYENHGLFLLAPSDFHHFEIEEETEFTFLKFTNVYLNSIGKIQITSRLNQDIDELLIHANKQHQLALGTATEIQKIESLVRLIVNEWDDTKDEMSEMIFFLILALLSLIKRHILPSATETHSKHSARLTTIINYIHQNIYSTELTQLEHLATMFGFSGNYFGIFFKEQMGITLRDYLNKYKLHLIENRLKYSSFSIKEISNELGFNDLSHFNKFYKNQTGINPTQFRQKLDKNAPKPTKNS